MSSPATESLCAICLAVCTESESRVVVSNMPMCGGEGLHVAHLACYTIRALSSASQQPRTRPCISPSPIPTNATCGMCTQSIAVDTEDALFYHGCPHAWVHLRCASLFDFCRRAGCPLCPAPARAQQPSSSVPRTTGPAAVSEKESMYVADADLFSPAGAVDVGEFSLQPVSATGQPPRVGEVVDLMNNNAVAHLFRDAQTSMRTIETAYASRFPVLEEPKYPTVVRAMCYEMGLNLRASPVTHYSAQGVAQPQTVLDVLSQRCHLGDLVKMGLTPAIMMRTPKDAAVLVDDILRADVIPKEEMPWPLLTFEALMRAGFPVSAFATTARSYLDLVLIKFSAPLFVAAGGTKEQLEKVMQGARGDVRGLLVQFGMVDALADEIFKINEIVY